MRNMSIMRNVVALIGMALVVGAMPAAAVALSKRTTTAANADVRQLVRMMDTDKNGTVSKDEFMQFMAQKFDRLDLDKSGRLESNELSNAASPFGKRTNATGNADVRHLVKMMDTDKSGTVSKDEFLQFVSQTFDR